jgi:hypothetical protein
LRGNEIVCEVVSVWKSGRNTDTLFPKIRVGFLRFLALLIVAVRDWLALVPTCQRLGVVVLLLDERGLQLEQKECRAYCRSRRLEEWRDRMQQKELPLDPAWRFRWCGRGTGERGRIVWKVR